MSHVEPIMRAVGKVIREHTKKNNKMLIEQLDKHLLARMDQAFSDYDKQLKEQLRERLGALKYVGTWKAGTEYRKGNFLSHAGALWHCEVDGTTETPGKSNDYRLCVKAPRQ